MALGKLAKNVSRHVVTLERPANDSNFNRRYATGTIRAPLPGVETAWLKSAAAHAAKTKGFFQKCPDIRGGPHRGSAKNAVPSLELSKRLPAIRRQQILKLRG
jgi:hypothetical protein